MTDVKRSLLRLVRGLVGQVRQRIVGADEALANFHDLGLDSDKLIELTSVINDSAGLRLRPSVLFSHASIAALVDHIVEQDCDGVVERIAARDEARRREPYSLIDLNRSAPGRGRLVKTLTTAEFFMEGHIHGGQYNFPGACYIEMALQAADAMQGRRFPVSLTQNNFLRRLSSFGEELDAEIVLEGGGYGDGHKYVIRPVCGSESVVPACAEGHIAPVEKAPPLEPANWRELRNAALLARRHGDVVRQLIDEGDQVDVHFIAAQEVFVRGDDALGFLALPDKIQNTHRDFILHPALLAGFMQTARVSNAVAQGSAPLSQVIPMAIERIDMFETPPSPCYAWLRRRPGEAGPIRKFDGVLIDEQGSVCVEIIGFTVKQTVGTADMRPESSSVRASVEESALEYLRGVVAPLLGYEPQALDPARCFEDYITNSIVIVEINTALEAVFGELSKTLLFEYDTLKALAGYFRAEHAAVLTGLGLAAGESARPHRSAETPAAEPSAQWRVVPPQDDPGAPEPAASPSAQSALEYLRGVVAPLLGYEPQALDPARRFEDYITNSIVIVEINTALEAVFGELSKTLLFEYDTLKALAGYFRAEHAAVLTGLGLAAGESTRAHRSAETPAAEPSARWRVVPPQDGPGAAEPRTDVVHQSVGAQENATRIPQSAADHRPSHPPVRSPAVACVPDVDGDPRAPIARQLYCEFTEHRLDVDRLAIAWNSVVQRHPILRLEMLEGSAPRIRRSVPPYGFQVYDARRRDEFAHLEALRGLFAAPGHRPGAWPLFSIAISLLDDERSIVHFRIAEVVIKVLPCDLLIQQWRRLYDEPAEEAVAAVSLPAPAQPVTVFTGPISGPGEAFQMTPFQPGRWMSS